MKNMKTLKLLTLLFTPMLLSNSLYSSVNDDLDFASKRLRIETPKKLSLNISDSSYNKPNINSYIDRELQQNGYIDLSKEFEKYKITYHYEARNPLIESHGPLDKKNQYKTDNLKVIIKQIISDCLNNGYHRYSYDPDPFRFDNIFFKKGGGYSYKAVFDKTTGLICHSINYDNGKIVSIYFDSLDKKILCLYGENKGKGNRTLLVSTDDLKFRTSFPKGYELMLLKICFLNKNFILNHKDNYEILDHVRDAFQLI